MTVKQQLELLNPTRIVVITDMDQVPIEEGIAGALLDESAYLSSPAVYTEDDFPFLIIVGEAL